MERSMISILKRLFCKHEFKFVRNIYGDEIIHSGWKRSVWRCGKCGRYKLADKLHRPSTEPIEAQQQEQS